MAPDFSTKEKAQALAGIDLLKESRAKTQFLKTLRKEWFNEAKKKGVFDPQGATQIGRASCRERV